MTQYSYDINTDPSKTIEVVTNRAYNKEEVSELLGDLRHCVGFVEDRWYVKVLRFKKGGIQAVIRDYDEKQLRAHYKSYRPFHSNRSITLVDIILRQPHRYQYLTAEFYTPNQQPPRSINLFQQFAFEEIITDDFSIIQPFLKHIKHTLCCDNEAKYQYFIKWWADLVQKCKLMAGSMPIIYGPQGAPWFIVWMAGNA
jgi:hypothetical protein